MGPQLLGAFSGEFDGFQMTTGADDGDDYCGCDDRKPSETEVTVTSSEIWYWVYEDYDGNADILRCIDAEVNISP